MDGRKVLAVVSCSCYWLFVREVSTCHVCTLAELYDTLGVK